LLVGVREKFAHLADECAGPIADGIDRIICGSSSLFLASVAGGEYCLLSLLWVESRRFSDNELSLRF
jgi:hypothetical protein